MALNQGSGLSTSVHAIGIALAVGLGATFLYVGTLWLAAVLFMIGLGVLVAFAMRHGRGGASP
jgi:hypothetical protein